MSFAKATKRAARGRIHLTGPSGSGKTRSALEIGRHLGRRVALIDTERGSASKYADLVDFDVCEIIDNYHPDKLVSALREAGAAYDVVIVDSFTHFWKGIGGFLELVDAEVARMKSRGQKPDSWSAWKVVDPIYMRTINAILSCPAHVIITTRAKQERVKETDDKTGKTSIRTVGLASEVREGLEYEVDVDGMLDLDHRLVIGKTRCPELDGRVFDKPGEEVARIMLAWLNDGAPVVAAPGAAPTSPVPAIATSAAPVQADSARLAEAAEIERLMGAATTLRDLEELLPRMKALGPPYWTEAKDGGHQVAWLSRRAAIRAANAPGPMTEVDRDRP
jgi:hypothetical protein